MLKSQEATFERVLGRLALLVSPFLVGYLIAVGWMLLHAPTWLHPLILGVACLGLLVGGSVLPRWLVKVPPGHAMPVEERVGSQVRAWLGGWHLNPFGYYQLRRTIPLWPRNRARLLYNVTVVGCPALTVKVTYVIQPWMPRAVSALPRPATADAPRERKAVANVFFMEAAPEAWEQDNSDLVETHLRQFFGDRPASQLYDLAGHVTLTPQRLYAELNTYLNAALAEEAYWITVRTVQVLGLEGPGTAMWQQQVVREVLGTVAVLPPTQALLLSEIYKTVAGSMGGRMGYMDPSVPVWLQTLDAQAAPPSYQAYPFPPAPGTLVEGPWSPAPSTEIRRQVA